MSLITIANSMKQRALERGIATEQMPRGAKLLLKWFADTQTFHLEITRARKSHNANALLLWKKEVDTFADAFGAKRTDTYTADANMTATTYTAVVTWREPNTAPRAEQRIPQNDAEIAEWAKTLGQGVKIRNVNVFTGEL